MTENTNTLNTVIVLRNGSKEAWETEGSYKLKAGEVGVGYMTVTTGTGETATTKTVPIIKVGTDGNTAWKDLPQAEGVFEEDQILTHNFGRHKTTNGSVNAGGKGMTTSEWLLDALSEVLNPTTSYPTASLKANGYTTDSDSNEIGSKIKTIKWKTTVGTGSYKGNDGTGTYGSSNGTTDASGIAATDISWEISNETDSQKAFPKGTANGEFVLTSDNYITINLEKANKYTFFNGTATIDVSKAATPKNNVGGLYEAGKIKGFDASGTTTKTFTDVAIEVTGYREGFFYGTTTSKTATTELTSAVIRGLKKSGTSYVAGNKSVTIPVGAATIIFACPAGKPGVTKVYNNTVNADMTTSFTKTENVSVGGADASSTSIGDYAANYNVWTFTPNEAYGTETSLTITLGEEEK